MRFHDVYLLSWVIEIDRLGALVAAVAGLLVFKWFLRHMLFRVLLKNFSLFRRFPVAIQHACLFHTNQWIAWMAWIAFLALASTTLLGVGWRGGHSSSFIPAKNGTVGFFLLIVFGRCSFFLDSLRCLHALKNIACLPIGPSFEYPSLYVGLFFLQVVDGLEDYLVEFFRVHLLGVAWFRETREVMI